jgi:hypothetical protein
MPLILSGTSGVPAASLSGVIPDVNAPSGSVLQVVSTQSTTQVSISTGNPQSIGLSASITVLANSKVLVLTVVPWFESGSGTWSNAGTSNLFHNGNQVCFTEHTGTTNAVAAAWTNPLNFTTGALTAGSHTFEVKHSITIGGTHVCMRDGRIGTIMLLEIAA